MVEIRMVIQRDEGHNEGTTQRSIETDELNWMFEFYTFCCKNERTNERTNK